MTEPDDRQQPDQPDLLHDSTNTSAAPTRDDKRQTDVMGGPDRAAATDDVMGGKNHPPTGDDVMAPDGGDSETNT